VVSVHLVPTKNELPEGDFDRLKCSIEENDLCLEQIENFK